MRKIVTKENTHTCVCIPAGFQNYTFSEQMCQNWKENVIELPCHYHAQHALSEGKKRK